MVREGISQEFQPGGGVRRLRVWRRPIARWKARVQGTGGTMKAGAICAVVLLCSVIVPAGPAVLIDADGFAPGPVLNDAFAGTVSTDVQDDSTVWAAESDGADDRDLREFRADFINWPAVCVSIDAVSDRAEDHGCLEVWLDNYGVEGPGGVTMHVASSLPIPNVLADTDSTAVADEIELDPLVQTPPAMIPVPRALLLLGSVTACLLCGLRKCRCL